MITYTITYKKANYEEIKHLVKIFKAKVPKHFTGLAGKALCFKFDSIQERFDFIEDFNKSLSTKSNKDFEIYETKAIIYLRK